MSADLLPDAPPRDCLVCGHSFRPAQRRRRTCNDSCRETLLRWIEGGARALRRKIAERELETSRMRLVLTELEGG